jgi:plastocyanin
MRVIRLGLSMVAALILVACGGGGGGSTAPPTTNNPQPTGGTPQTLGTISTSVTTMSLGAGDGASIIVSARDTQGSAITSFTPTYSSQNPLIAEVSAAGGVFAIKSGSTTIDVSVTMGSVTKTASVAVSVTGALKSIANIAANNDQAYPSFTPDKVVIAVGGTVSWDFGSLEHTVTFDGGSAGTPQNIPGAYSTSVRRDFSTKGNFKFHCTIHSGMSGEVVVR